jgi:1,4-dihydroxy-2-naphthoyl-CoA hydrolase
MIKASVDEINKLNSNTLSEELGIIFTEVGADFVSAKMPVDHRTKQPFGLLHGGASVALAETLGSVAANLVTGFQSSCVGVEINANHLLSVKEGFVYGTAKPIRIGKSMHVWGIEIKDEKDNMICISRLTVLVKSKGV